MSNIELTLLSLKDLINMKALKNYGLKAECTDLALITGGVYYENEKEYDTLYWTRTTTSMGSVYSLNKDGKSASLLDHERRGIIRPVLLNYNNITKETFIQNEEIELGEYPQYAPSKSIQRLLERKYQSNSLKETGNKYTFDSVQVNHFSSDFSPVVYLEYEYNNKKYIRVKTNFYHEKIKLANGIVCKNGKHIWIEVSKVKWIVDSKTNTLIAKNGLLSGIRFLRLYQTYDNDFSMTDMKYYLDNYMYFDIFQNILSKNSKHSIFKYKIEDLLEEIKYIIRYNPLKEKIITEINNLLMNYNNRIKDNSVNDKKLIFKDPTEKHNIELETSLIRILNIIKEDSDYINILNSINMYLEILNKKEVEETDDLGKDLMIVSNYLLPFLNESDSNLIKNSLINFITSEKEKIKTYLTDKYRDNELVNKPNYNNIEELKIKIRFYLQEVLKEINKKVEEKDLILEIKENIQNIINYKLTEGKSRVFSLYIDIIETIVTELRNLINGIDEITKKEEFINNLNNILNEDISENNNMYDIMNQTRNMIILLYQLQIDINDYINFQNNLNAMTFTLIK